MEGPPCRSCGGRIGMNPERHKDICISRLEAKCGTLRGERDLLKMQIEAEEVNLDILLRMRGWLEPLVATIPDDSDDPLLIIKVALKRALAGEEPPLPILKVEPAVIHKTVKPCTHGGAGFNGGICPRCDAYPKPGVANE